MQRWLLGIVTAIGLSVSACGGAPTGPSRVVGPGISLEVQGGRASLVPFLGSGTAVVQYESCHSLLARGSRAIIILNFVYTLIGPDDSTYRTVSDSAFFMRKIGGTSGDFVGCSRIYSDGDIRRPPATTYRIDMEYTFEGEPLTTKSQTLSGRGSIVSTVADRPLMSGVTIHHDITESQMIIRTLRPVTFEVVGSGGVTPYQFQWRLNGFLLRDWDPHPTLVLDPATTLIGGGPVGPGTWTLAVSGRSDGSWFSEASARLTFSFAR